MSKMIQKLHSKVKSCGKNFTNWELKWLSLKVDGEYSKFILIHKKCVHQELKINVNEEKIQCAILPTVRLKNNSLEEYFVWEEEEGRKEKNEYKKQFVNCKL